MSNSDVIEFVIRGRNELGPALSQAASQMQQLGAQVAAQATVPVADLSKHFEQLVRNMAAIKPTIASIANVRQVLDSISASTQNLNQLTAVQRQLYQAAQAEVARHTQQLASQARAQAQVREEVSRLNGVTRETAAVTRQAASSVAASGAAFGTLRSIATSLVPALTAVGAAFAVFNTIKDSLREFIAAEAGVRALSASLETVGADVGKLTGELEKLIVGWEKASVFDDDELRASLTTLITITGDVAASTKTMGAVMDLSAARGISLASATEIVGRALEGNVLQLTRMGVKFSDADKLVFEFGNEIERAAVLVERFAEAFGGRATAQIDTFQGKLKRLQDSWGDLKEEIGGALVSALVWFDEVGKKVNQARDFLDKYINVWRIAATLVGRGPVAERPFDAHPNPLAPWENPDVVSGASSRLHTSEAEAARARAKAEKDAEDAARASAKWKSEIQKLNEEWVALRRNIAATPAGFKAFAGEIVKTLGRLDALGVKLTDTQRRFLDLSRALLKAPQRDLHVQAFEQFQALALSGDRWIQQMLNDPNRLINQRLELSVEAKEASFRAAGIVVGQEAREEIEQAGKRLADDLAHVSRTFTEPVADIFGDLFTTGGENFGNIAAAILENSAKGFGNTAADLMTVALGALTGEGTRIDPQTGRPVFQRGSVAGQIGGGLLTGAATGYGLYRSQIDAQQAMRSRDIGIQANMAGLQTLASGGGWIAAVVAVAVSAVMGHLGQAEARDRYKYAVPGIDESGRARLTEVNRNVREEDARRMVTQIQERFDLVWNGMVRVVSTFADSLPELVMTIDGRFQGAASANFLRHFDTWLNETLPRDVTEKFRGALGGIAESLGFSTERFNEIWTHLESLDPTKAAALWGSLFTAAKAFEETLTFFRTPLQTTVGGGLDIQTGLLQQTWDEMTQTFAESLVDVDDKITRLAFAMSNMTGEQQIQAAQELGQLLNERMETEKAFLRDIIAGIESIKQSFGASIRELELEGMRTAEGAPDIEAQMAYLQEYTDQLIAQLRTAPDTQTALALSEEIRQNILRIRQLGGSQGPDAEEAYRQWALENLRMVQQLAIDRLNQLAQEMTNANARLIDAIQGFIDAFLAGTAALTAGQPPGTPPPGTPPVTVPGGTGEELPETMDMTSPSTAAGIYGRLGELVEEARAARAESTDGLRALAQAIRDEGIAVDGGELRIIVERADTGERVADFVRDLQATRVARGRR